MHDSKIYNACSNIYKYNVHNRILKPKQDEQQIAPYYQQNLVIPISHKFQCVYQDKKLY